MGSRWLVAGGALHPVFLIDRYLWNVLEIDVPTCETTLCRTNHIIPILYTNIILVTIILDSHSSSSSIWPNFQPYFNQPKMSFPSKMGPLFPLRISPTLLRGPKKNPRVSNPPPNRATPTATERPFGFRPRRERNPRPLGPRHPLGLLPRRSWAKTCGGRHSTWRIIP